MTCVFTLTIAINFGLVIANAEIDVAQLELTTHDP